MTLLAQLPSLTDHTVLHGVTWDDYEQLLDQIGDRAIRVTYFQGSMEIMSPLPKHERLKSAVSRLIELMTFDLDIPLIPFGSVTVRREDKQSGLEPDECYYLSDEQWIRDMERFDALVRRPPDLAVEIDVFNRSIAREPIYARLGIPELWRFHQGRLTVRILTENGVYADATASKAFPFLAMPLFERFAQRMLNEPQNGVLREFQAWVRTLIKP